MLKTILVAISALGLLSACVTADVRVSSNKEATYNKKLDRLLVAVNLEKFGVDGARVGQMLSQQLSARGVKVETVIVRPLDLDPSRKVNEAKYRFKATQLLILEGGSVKSEVRTGVVRSFSVEALISDTASVKTVWRASIEHLGSDSSGERLATAVVERLGLDGML